jgi:hypothetical protein
VQSFALQKLYSLRADANALGGYLEKPLQKAIPTLAPVSLPAVGGVATARSEAFTLDEIVSCSAAYTRVSGRENPVKDGISSSSLLVTAVVEDLNILEVVRAERVVAQLSIDLSSGSALKISLAGSAFEGLWLAGKKCHPDLNEDLQKPGLTWEDVRGAGLTQGEKVLPDFQKFSEDAYQWALSRHRRMSPNPKKPADGDSAGQPVGGGSAQVSLVNSLSVSGFGRSCGHVVEIPHFGRIIFGELLISRETVQLVAIRAELGCVTGGRITACCGGGGGTGEN